MLNHLTTALKYVVSVEDNLTELIYAVSMQLITSFEVPVYISRTIFCFGYTSN